MRCRGLRLHDGKRFVCRAVVDEDGFKGDAGVLLGHDANDAIELFEKDRKRFLLVVARHDNGDERHGGLPLVFIRAGGNAAAICVVHVDLPLLTLNLCNGIKDKPRRETQAT